MMYITCLFSQIENNNQQLNFGDMPAGWPARVAFMNTPRLNHKDMIITFPLCTLLQNCNFCPFSEKFNSRKRCRYSRDTKFKCS